MLFKTQSYLTIELDTEVDLTTATVFKILFQKPDGTKSEWVAEISGTTAMKYIFAGGEIDQVGDWKVQPYAELGGKKLFGNIEIMSISEPLQ